MRIRYAALIAGTLKDSSTLSIFGCESCSFHIDTPMFTVSELYLLVTADSVEFSQPVTVRQNGYWLTTTFRFRVSERSTLEQPVQESPIVSTLCSNETLIIINPRACTQFDNVARGNKLCPRSHSDLPTSNSLPMPRSVVKALMHVSWSVYSFANLQLDNIFILSMQKLQLQVY